MYSETIKKGQRWELRGDSTNKVKIKEYYGGIVVVMDIKGSDMGHYERIPESKFRKNYRLIQNV